MWWNTRRWSCFIDCKICLNSNIHSLPHLSHCWIVGVVELAMIFVIFKLRVLIAIVFWDVHGLIHMLWWRIARNFWANGKWFYQWKHYGSTLTPVVLCVIIHTFSRVLCHSINNLQYHQKTWLFYLSENLFQLSMANLSKTIWILTVYSPSIWYMFWTHQHLQFWYLYYTICGIFFETLLLWQRSVIRVTWA